MAAERSGPLDIEDIDTLRDCYERGISPTMAGEMVGRHFKTIQGYYRQFKMQGCIRPTGNGMQRSMPVTLLRLKYMEEAND